MSTTTAQETRRLAILAPGGEEHAPPNTQVQETCRPTGPRRAVAS